MADIDFLLVETVLAIHEAQIATHGGIMGLRDRGLLDSALARPRNRLMLDATADPASLAADTASSRRQLISAA